ncbi:restriction endonuclease subunit S [Lactiplantibacillus modestisalitolerans]|uniref:Restriction endonuclease subunit S n=1 Tax=Lactiplantibacillus modestisalitolerans TaxID=1457219 RepID=A0ABV5WUY4_9LACO|nr:restriction endonuclease subunit S [Lactiplantibacillus modestisalitolerans]
MYFQNPEKVQSNNIDTRTFVLRIGDIAFEGHPNRKFAFGRFVENDIGDGVISELFPIYKHIQDYNLLFWKYYIHREDTMHNIIAHALTSSGNSSNKIDEADFLRQYIMVPSLKEQKKIGGLMNSLDNLIAANERYSKSLIRIYKRFFSAKIIAIS